MPKQEYLDIPKRVKEAAVRLFPFYNFVRSKLASSDGRVWFNPDSVGDDFTKNAVFSGSYTVTESLQDKGLLIGQVDSLDASKDWIFVEKRADHVLKPVVQAANLAPAPWNAPLGGFGTSPLFSMLTSGLLGGGLGYMGGTLLENLFPEDYMERGKLRKNLAILGGLGGAAGPAYLGTVGHRNWNDPNRSAWRSWIEPNVFFGKQNEAIKQAYVSLAEKDKDEDVDNWLSKEAVSEYSGLAITPTIPVDAFNRVVMQDPFASMPLQTATIGITEAANQAKGNSGIISPFDIARIGLGMGAGLSQAYLGGKVLGALAGLTPKAQETLQQAGMFAGALKAVVPGLFGR
jgi:hypothetical protein